MNISVPLAILTSTPTDLISTWVKLMSSSCHIRYSDTLVLGLPPYEHQYSLGNTCIYAMCLWVGVSISCCVCQLVCLSVSVCVSVAVSVGRGVCRLLNGRKKKGGKKRARGKKWREDRREGNRKNEGGGGEEE